MHIKEIEVTSLHNRAKTRLISIVSKPISIVVVVVVIDVVFVKKNVR